ncbi:MAG: GPO family capsid scaffolding protein [Betaproteobacteria bacterium]|nr:GPO family capsid scaffolding protein [Betaproteobacteria bacterium]
MATASKFFRVAVEGTTVDGRTIKRNWLEEMAASYNPATYAARINCEHLRGFSPEKPFFSYGDVTALKTEEIDLDIGGKTEKRLALFAQITPNAEFSRINKAGQKVFSSIEVNENFAGTGKAYLVGMACTDSPASLGTERLEFAAKASNNFYSPAMETTIEVEGLEPAPGSEAGAIVAGFKALLAHFTKPAQGEPEQKPQEPAKPAGPANDNAALTASVAAITTALAALPDTLTKLAADQAAATKKVADDLAALTAKLGNTDANPPRKDAPGGVGFAATDC